MKNFVKNHFLIFLLLILPSSTYATDATFQKCIETLIYLGRTELAERWLAVSKLRNEMMEAWHAHRMRFPKREWYGQPIGPESTAVDPTAFGGDAHVINLAGASNFLRIRYLYPLAKHIHIADAIDPYANHNFITNFLNMQRAIAPDAKVTIVQKGFYEEFKRIFGKGLMPINPTKFNKFEASLRAEESARKPLITRVEWESPSHGKMERYFYFHPIDLSVPREVHELVRSIPKEAPLAGMTMFGVGVFGSLDQAKLALEMNTDSGKGYWEATGPRGGKLKGEILQSTRGRTLINLLKIRLSNTREKALQDVKFALKRRRFRFRKISNQKLEIRYKDKKTGKEVVVVLQYNRKKIASPKQFQKLLTEKPNVVGVEMAHDASVEVTFKPLFDRMASGGSYVTADQDANISHLLPQGFRYRAASGLLSSYYDPDGIYPLVDVYQKP